MVLELLHFTAEFPEVTPDLLFIPLLPIFLMTHPGKEAEHMISRFLTL